MNILFEIQYQWAGKRDGCFSGIVNIPIKKNSEIGSQFRRQKVGDHQLAVTETETQKDLMAFLK